MRIQRLDFYEVIDQFGKYFCIQIVNHEGNLCFKLFSSLSQPKFTNVFNEHGCGDGVSAAGGSAGDDTALIAVCCFTCCLFGGQYRWWWWRLCPPFLFLVVVFAALLFHSF